MSTPQRAHRVREVIAAVCRQALRDRGAQRVALLDDGTPETELAAGILAECAEVVRVAPLGPELESLLHPAGADADRLRLEGQRLRARLLPDALPAWAASKTVLLLAGPLPPEPLLPLGDLYATEVAELAGGWSAPEEVRAVVERAGGVERVDRALRLFVEGRDPRALEGLGAGAAEIRALLARGAASRRAAHVVPKLGSRTLAADLFE